MGSVPPAGPSIKEILLESVEKTQEEHALDTVEPSKTFKAPTADTKVNETPACITQDSIPPPLAGTTDIVVGLGNEVPRWVPGSVIKWTAWRKGFSSDQDTQHAVNHTEYAAQSWNQARVGVTFQFVPDAKDATFVLCWGGAKGSVLASAFFPNANDLNYVFVYSYAFKPNWKDNLWKVMTHELGHVLGLRHEFAIGDVPSNMQAEGQGAVRIDPPNEYSVMNYRSEPPEIQQSDIYSTRKFYSMTDDANGNPPKVGKTDIADYTPM